MKIKLVQYSYQNGPTNLSRVTTKNGTGFILKRLNDLGEATKLEVYDGFFDVDSGHGSHNYVWAILLNSGIIECVNGYRKPGKRSRFLGYTKCMVTYTYKKEPARYALTGYGRKILENIKD